MKESIFRLGLSKEDHITFLKRMIITAMIFIITVLFIILILVVVPFVAILGIPLVIPFIFIIVSYIFFLIVCIIVVLVLIKTKKVQNVPDGFLKVLPDRLEFVLDNSPNDIPLKNMVDIDNIEGIVSEIKDFRTYGDHSYALVNQKWFLKRMSISFLRYLLPRSLEYVHFIILKEPVEWDFIKQDLKTMRLGRSFRSTKEIEVNIDPKDRERFLGSLSEVRRLNELPSPMPYLDRGQPRASLKESPLVFRTNIGPKEIRLSNLNDPRWLLIIMIIMAIAIPFSVFRFLIGSEGSFNFHDNIFIPVVITSIVGVMITILIIVAIVKTPKEKLIHDRIKVELYSNYLEVYRLSPDEKRSLVDSFHLSFVDSIERLPQRYSDIKERNGLLFKKRYIFPGYSIHSKAANRNDLLLVRFKKKMNLMTHLGESRGPDPKGYDKAIIEIRNEDQDRFFEEVLNRKMRYEK